MDLKWICYDSSQPWWSPLRAHNWYRTRDGFGWLWIPFVSLCLAAPSCGVFRDPDLALVIRSPAVRIVQFDRDQTPWDLLPKRRETSISSCREHLSTSLSLSVLRFHIFHTANETAIISQYVTHCFTHLHIFFTFLHTYVLTCSYCCILLHTVAIFPCLSTKSSCSESTGWQGSRISPEPHLAHAVNQSAVPLQIGTCYA